jgi:hypothetical protein
MSSRYMVEKVSFGIENLGMSHYDLRLNKIIPDINNGQYADDGWMLVSITPITAQYSGISYTSHLILLFKRV